MLDETLVYTALSIFNSYSVGLCVGVSAMAMINYFYVVSKGSTTPSERHMMGIVYLVLRVGMALIVLSELSIFYFHYQNLNFDYIFENPPLAAKSLVFMVIMMNAYGMQIRKITMWLGPAIAGGSWSFFFFLSTAYSSVFSLTSLLKAYISWLLVMTVVLGLLRIVLTRYQTTLIGDGEY